MYSTILVPTDGSDASELALDRALDLARTVDADVHVLSVVETGDEPVGLDEGQRDELRHRSEERSRQATDRAAERASELGMEATRTVGEGAPAETILEYGTEHDIDLLVMGTQGRAGPDRVRLGSTTERVIARATVPVLAVRPTESAPDVEAIAYDRIVIPTDGSDAAERAAERGLDIAETYGASVYVPYVIDTAMYDLEDTSRSLVGLLKEGGQSAVEAVAEDARARALSVKTDVLRGSPETELVEYAEGVGGDLVVMGTRGHGVSSGDVLGSTTARVLRRTTAPVLAVR
jgi:nucleotide-binding universal stress UspA family protein